jgi:hypothetical protein
VLQDADAAKVRRGDDRRTWRWEEDRPNGIGAIEEGLRHASMMPAAVRPVMDRARPTRGAGHRSAATAGPVSADCKTRAAGDSTHA